MTVHKHKLPAIVHEVKTIRNSRDTQIYHLCSHLQPWWLVFAGFQYHDTITVNAVQAAFKHQGCRCHTITVVF